MAVREDLIAQIRAAISGAAGLGYNEPAATNDIYENYVWTLCLEAARSKGATVTYNDVLGASATALTFRTSAGAIYSRAHPYTHAVLECDRCPALEAHIGVRVIGKSRVLHECDVAVLYKEEADLCRAEQVHPRAARVLIAAECKFY